MKLLNFYDIKQTILMAKQKELDRWRIIRKLKAFGQLTSEPANTHQLWHDGYLAGLKEARRIIEYLARNKYKHIYHIDYEVNTDLSLEENLLNTLITNEDLQPTEFSNEIEIALQKAYESAVDNNTIYPEVDILAEIHKLHEEGLEYEYKDNINNK